METKVKESYKQMLARHQCAANELPIRFAFSNEQFEKMLEEFGVTEQEIVFIGAGGFARKKDIDYIGAQLAQIRDEKRRCLDDPEIAYEAFLYEMQNHEYHINMQAEYDLFSCFGDVEYAECKSADEYIDELGLSDDSREAFHDALYRFYQMCDEQEWW